MYSSWIFLLLWTTYVSAFYPYSLGGTGSSRKRFFPIAPPPNPPPSLTLDLKKVPIKRDNSYNVVLSNNPSSPNAVAIHQDGSDYSYFCTMSFGSKGQKMYMLIDTGSANTWVMAEDCNSDACKVHNLFGPDDSTTLNRTKTPWSITYGTGTVSGVMASDLVTIASFNIQLGFGMATSASDDFNNYPMDGILGIGRPASNELDAPPLMEVLKTKGLISQKIMGIHLQRGSDNLKDGVLTFGDVDTSKFSGKLNYVNTINTEGWEVQADDASVDGKACNFKSKSAIIDTGTSYILMPPSDAATLHNLIPGSAKLQDTFYVPCNAKALVQFTLGGVMYGVLPKDYVGRATTGGQCFSNIIGHQAFGVNQWILGDVFLKNVYAVFDFDKSRIGFGLSSTSTSSSSSSTSSSPSSSSTSSGSSSSSQSSSPGSSSSPLIPTTSSNDSTSSSGSPASNANSNPSTTSSGASLTSSPFGSSTATGTSSGSSLLQRITKSWIGLVGMTVVIVWGF